MADNSNTPKTGETPEQTTELTFDSWIAEQPEPVSELINTHTSGLKSALDSERATRKELEKTLKQMTGQLEEGSAAKKQLEGISQQLQETERRATFTEVAAAAGIAPDALRLAYLAAQDLNAFNSDGAPDIDRLKNSYPHLFSKPRAATTTAGAGTNGQPASMGQTMDDIIRKKAGRL
jgi:small-conductance mechanosensitive channel